MDGSMHNQAYLCPHLLDIFQYHIEVPVKGLDPREQFSIVPAVDEHLRKAVSQHTTRGLV